MGESSVEERVGRVMAREGYGSAGGGALVTDRSSLGRIVRSVAVYASGRRGNVASESTELWDTCLGCVKSWRLDGKFGFVTSCAALFRAERLPVISSKEPDQRSPMLRTAH